MLIDIRPLLTGATVLLPFAYELDPPAPFEGLVFPAPVKIEGEVRNQAGYMTLSARAEVPFETSCARCLSPIHRRLSLDFTRTLTVKPAKPTKEGEDEYIRIVDGQVDIDAPLLEDLLLSVDRVYLCRQDCKGLCPRCGKNRNEGDCGCAEQKEIDPRLSILAKLLDK